MQKPFFYAVDHEIIGLPEGVMPWTPTFSPDGRYILFHDYNGGREWMVQADGMGLKCITGGMEDRPDFLGGFYYLLDDKRMFLSNELGDTAVILECEPSVYDWKSYQFLPIDLSADAELGRLCLGRRTYHMAPDGKHLSYNILTSVGLVMVICTLERWEDRYVATDYYCLNPEGPVSANDPEQEHWSNGGTLAEFKAFCDGGRGFLFVTEGDSGNIDQYKCDFETGKVTRLSFDPDWDEDGACSPDGEHTVCASWRGMGQLDVLNCVPGSLPLLSFYLGAVIAVHYVSSFPGFANDLQPWLLSGKDISGQPLAPYHGGNWIVANNIAGHPMWSPDSTKVLLQERDLTPPPDGANERVLEKGKAPNRLHISKLRKASAERMPIVETKIGSWAKRLKEYRANGDYPGDHIIPGRHSGSAKLNVDGNLLRCNHCVEYVNFSNDGIHFLNGTESVRGNANDLAWKQNLIVTGAEQGETDIDLHFVKKNPQPPRNIPPMTLRGHAKSTWNGVIREGLPGFGPKPAVLPKPSPLNLRTQLLGNVVEIHVAADIYGDVRPVCGAEVTFDGERKITGMDGKVQFPAKNGTIEADAGSNFLPAIMNLYI